MISASKDAAAMKLRRRKPNATDDEIDDYLDRAEAYFCEATGRRSVPARALLLWVDVAAAIGTGMLDNVQGGVSAIKRGDTTINYSSDAASRLAGLDARIAMYKVARQL